jgi:hypothetical protein
MDGDFRMNLEITEDNKLINAWLILPSFVGNHKYLQLIEDGEKTELVTKASFGDMAPIYAQEAFQLAENPNLRENTNKFAQIEKSFEF